LATIEESTEAYDRLVRVLNQDHPKFEVVDVFPAHSYETVPAAQER
jgi:hypothetical protein